MVTNVTKMEQPGSSQSTTCDFQLLQQRIVELEAVDRQRKHAVNALCLSEARYRSFVEHFHGVVLLCDLHFNPIIVNGLVEEITGYTEKQLLDKSPGWDEIIFSDDRSIWEANREQLQAVPKFITEREYRIVRKDGQVRWMSETIQNIIDSDGVPVMTQAIITDINERKQADEQLHEGLAKLRRTLDGTVHALSATAAWRDPYTAGHQHRVAQLSCAISREMGLSAVDVEGMHIAALLHDIGKIAVPIEILSKPRRVNEYEYAIIKTHSQVGYDILHGIDFPWPIAQVALQHHWRLDGSGYPGDYAPEAHLMQAKILTVADVIEAISSHRPYRPALGTAAALAEVTTQAGILYDTEVTKACLSVFQQNFAFT